MPDSRPLPGRRDLISVQMACNDPDNGNFTGRVCQIALGNDALQLTARAWMITSFARCPRLREIDGHFILAGKRWPFIRRKAWVGNWCWDGYAMTAQSATDFLVWLHERGLFQCEGGWVELCDAWDAPAPLTLPEQWWAL